MRRRGNMPRRFVPILSRQQIISGITLDAAGNVLGGCTVILFRTADNSVEETQVSDATTGYYIFSSINDAGPFYVVAYKPGSPDVTGATVDTLVGS